MRREPRVRPGVVGHLDAAQGTHRTGEDLAPRRRHVPGADGVRPGRLGALHPRDHLARDVGCGHQLDADRLGERADRRRRQLVVQAWHEPVEPVGRHTGQHRDRDVHGDAVGGGARVVLVGQRQLEVALRPHGGEARRVDSVRGLVCDEHLEREVQQRRLRAPGGLPPRVEVPRGDDVGRHPLVVEREERVVVHHEPPAPCPVLQLLGLLEHRGVGVEERVVGGPLAAHQRVPEEQLACVLGVHRREEHPTLRHDRDAVEQHLLEARRSALLGGPHGLGVRALDEVRGELLGPLGLHARDVPGPQA